MVCKPDKIQNSNSYIRDGERRVKCMCLTMFYAAVGWEDGTEFKVSSLKAIRAAIDRKNTPWSIVGDSAFQKSNKVLNAICKQMMQEGKVGLTIHKNPITSGQLQQLYETGQLGEWDTLDPSQLLRTAWFYITFYFVKRVRENQRKLTSDMLVLRSTPQGRRYYEFRSPFAFKNPPEGGGTPIWNGRGCSSSRLGV